MVVLGGERLDVRAEVARVRGVADALLAALQGYLPYKKTPPPRTIQ